MDVDAAFSVVGSGETRKGGTRRTAGVVSRCRTTGSYEGRQIKLKELSGVPTFLFCFGGVACFAEGRQESEGKTSKRENDTSR